MRPIIFAFLLLCGSHAYGDQQSHGLHFPTRLHELAFAKGLPAVDLVREYFLSKHQTAYAELNVTDAVGHTPVHAAASRGNAEVLQLFIEHGADVNLCDNAGNHPLHLAVAGKHADAVKVIVAHCTPSSLNWSDAAGEKPISIAIKNNDAESCEVLLGARASCDAKNDEGFTPLYVAARAGHAHIVKLLIVNIERYRDVKRDLAEIVDNVGNTLLHHAVMWGHVDVVRVLCDTGADVNLSNYRGFTPLHLAAEHDREPIVKILIDANVDVNACYDPTVRTRVEYCVVGGMGLICLFNAIVLPLSTDRMYAGATLISLGATYIFTPSFNQPSFLGPSHYDGGERTAWYCTPFDMAKWHTQKGVADLLQQHGGKTYSEIHPK